MNELITDKEIIERLPDEDKQQFLKLIGQEELAKVLGKELPDHIKESLNRYRNIGYHETWKIKIDIDDSTKEKIIKATDKIHVKESVDEEGSRLIEFKLGYIKYKILDPRLENHTDEKYRQHHSDNSITKVDRDYVLGGGIESKNYWANRKLLTYVSQKGKEGLHIPTGTEMGKLYGYLGKIAGLTDDKDEIAMLMYLTGMDGSYWLNMNYDTYDDYSWEMRGRLECNANKAGRNLRGHGNFSDISASLCMISYELDDIGTILKDIKDGEKTETIQNILQRLSNKNKTLIRDLKEVWEYEKKMALLDETIQEAKNNLEKLKGTSLNLGNGSMVLEKLEGYIECLESYNSRMENEIDWQHQRSELSREKDSKVRRLDYLNKSYGDLPTRAFGKRKEKRDEYKETLDSINSIDALSEELWRKIKNLPERPYYESILNSFRD